MLDTYISSYFPGTSSLESGFPGFPGRRIWFDWMGGGDTGEHQKSGPGY